MILLTAVTVAMFWLLGDGNESPDRSVNWATIQLPAPSYDGEMSVEAALRMRRSIRTYDDQPLSIEQVSQLLWAAQGTTDRAGHRTAPSAGALYPLEIFLLAGEVDGIAQGIYRYLPADHTLSLHRSGDQRNELQMAALNQSAIGDGAVVILLTAIFERTEVKYGPRSAQYIHIEVGNVAQNIYLQSTALDLGTVFIGAFYEDQVKAAIGLEGAEEPLGIMPVGSKSR